MVTQAGVDGSRQNGDKVNVGGVARGDMAGVPLFLHGHEGPLGGCIGQVVGCCNLGLNRSCHQDSSVSCRQRIRSSEQLKVMISKRLPQSAQAKPCAAVHTAVYRIRVALNFNVRGAL